VHIFAFTAAASAILSLGIALLTDAFLGERIAILGDWVGLQLSHNPGIAFGLHLGPYQDAVIITAILALVWAAHRTARTRIEQVAFGLVIGGGIANAIDRVLDGVVTDMVQVGTFPIFNMADICINVGAGLLLLSLAREWWKGR
jgi:signal peptidase II